MRAPAKKPFGLYVLAGLGILLGSLGACFALASAAPLLQSRDHFVEARREVFERPLSAVSALEQDGGSATPDGGRAADGGPSASAQTSKGSTSTGTGAAELLRLQPSELLKLVEIQANVVYSRRGVALPLGAMNLILSLLLLAGAIRALRGQPWGLSAWQLAALASIPYELLDWLVSQTQARELETALREAGGTLAELAARGAAEQSAFSSTKSALALLYFTLTLWYLRRSRIQALFHPLE